MIRDAAQLNPRPPRESEWCAQQLHPRVPNGSVCPERRPVILFSFEKNKIKMEVLRGTTVRIWIIVCLSETILFPWKDARFRRNPALWAEIWIN